MPDKINEYSIQDAIAEKCKKKLDESALIHQVYQREKFSKMDETVVQNIGYQLAFKPKILWEKIEQFSEYKYLLHNVTWATAFKFVEKNNPDTIIGPAYSNTASGWMQGEIGNVSITLLPQSDGQFKIKVEDFSIEIDYRVKRGRMPVNKEVDLF